MRRPYLRGHDPRLTETFCSPTVLSLAKPYFPTLRRSESQDQTDSDEEEENIPVAIIHPMVDINPPVKLKASRKPGPLARIEVNGSYLGASDKIYLVNMVDRP
jgi:hypothetical protein